MRRYIIRRLWTSIPVMFLITIIVFTMISMTPGDMIHFLIESGESTVAGNREALRAQLGLDKPLPIRYILWLKEVLTGNLGYSGMSSLPVARLMGMRLGPTVLLMGTAMLISICIGIPLGILSALRQYSRFDYGVAIFAFTWVSIPGFFAGLAALYLFSLKIPIFPVFGMETAGGAPNRLTDVLWHLALPATVLGLEHTATFVRYTRASMLEVIRQDYVTTARAKGLSERVVIYRHAFRNALLPLLTITGLQLPSLFGGSVLIESIFGWPGMGLISVQAVTNRDYTTIMAFNLITAVLVMGSNLLTDLSYAVADPRIRYE